MRRARDPGAVQLAQALGAALLLRTEVGLGHAGGGGDERQRVRMGRLQVAGEVDDADDLAGLRVVDRRARALPRVDEAAEVLGGEDLDRMVDGDRRAERIGSGALLAPVGAADEVHVLGRLDHVLMALDPQEHAARVRDHEHVAGPRRRVRQQVAQHGQHRVERMVLPAVGDRVLVHDDRRAALAGIDAGFAGPRPGLLHDGTHVTRDLVSGVEGVVHAAKRPRIRGPIGDRVDGEPRAADGGGHPLTVALCVPTVNSPDAGSQRSCNVGATQP